MPLEAFGHDSVLNLEDEQTFERLVEEAKQMLIGRMLTIGGSK